MSRPNQKKITTDGGAAVGGGMFQAFSGLEIGGLPDGDAIEPKNAGPPERGPEKRGRVVLRRETAHRGGKCVIVVEGFDPSVTDDDLEALHRKLRNQCGCGGTRKGRLLEFQGEQAARLRELLSKEGFKVAGVS